MNDVIKAVMAELKRHGIQYRLSTEGRGAGSHPRIYFAHGDREQFVVCPGTPSDSFRAERNAVAELRRILGVTGARPKSEREKKYRPKTQRPVVAPGTISTGLDGLQGLMDRLSGTPLQMRALKLRSDRALADTWRDACRKTSGYDSISEWFKQQMAADNFRITPATGVIMMDLESEWGMREGRCRDTVRSTR